MERANERLDWLEIAIFAFYITEVTHILGDLLFPAALQLISIILFSVLGMILVFNFLFGAKKERKTIDSQLGSEPSMKKFALKLIPIAIVGFIVVGSYLFVWPKFGPLADSAFWVLWVILALCVSYAWQWSRHPNSAENVPSLAPRREWSKAFLVALVLAIYSGHLISGGARMFNNWAVAGEQSGLRDTESVVQRIDRNLSALVHKSSSTEARPDSATLKELQDISATLKSVDSRLERLNAERPQPGPGDKLPSKSRLVPR
jgi:hypothetical protein